MKSTFTKLLALVLVFVMVAGIMAGCTKPATTTPDATTPDQGTTQTADTLVYANDYLSQKFSPFFADTSYDQDAAGLTQISLLGSDREGNVLLNAGTKDGQVVPYNGKDYTYYALANCVITENADGTVTYAITMRDDVTFSDGKKVTADDVIFSMYVLSDPTFDGSSTLYSQAIVGMEEYRAGMESRFNLVLATENKGYTANDYFTEEQYNEFWAAFDKAGVAFAQEIIDYCVASYADAYGEAYVGATGDAIRADEALQVKLGMFLWGYDAAWTEGATAADYWAAIFETYGYNTSAEDGINYESAGSTIEALTFDALGDKADAFRAGVSTGEGAANISGIKKTGDYTLEVTVAKVDPTFIYQLTLAVAPMHYYGDASKYDYANNSFGFTKGDLATVRAKTTTPMGAGPYKFVSYENNVASYEANETYYLGAPKIKYFKMQGVGSSDKVSGMTTDIFDATVPNFNDDDIAAIKKANPNGELIGDKLTTLTTDFLGYGYIGINADNVKIGEDKGSEESKALRRAIATLMAVYREPVVYAYYGDRASIIQYPISNTSWAAPKPADEGYNLAYSKNAAGEVVITADMTQEEKVAAAKAAAKTLFEAAGYTFGADGKLASAPEGGATSWEIIIPADGKGDHPAYGILTETKNAMAEMGLELIINDPSDSNELWDALDAGTADMWAAAWGATPDPDMYQVYHSSNVHGVEGSSNSNHYGIQSADLDKLIMDGRSTTDQAFRKATYKAALELLMDWGVEVPTYQRQEATLLSTERINISTVPGDLTPYYGWLAEIHTLEMN